MPTAKPPYPSPASYAALRKQVLASLQPDPALRKHVVALVASWQKAARAKGFSVTFVLGGSLAKQTHVKDTHDADVFAVFDKKQDNLSDTLEQILAALKIPATRCHGSRDYFRTVLDTVTFEFVPVRKVTAATIGNIENVTDASVLHIAWFEKKATHKPILLDEVRLTKAFFKAHSIYGAESYVGGFSGHVVDILIVKYGSFLKLLKAVATWDPPVYIDVERHYAGKKQALAALNDAKKTSPLICIDPIDKTRNASASLEVACMDTLRAQAATFLKAPSLKAFTFTPINLAAMQKKKGHTLCVALAPLEGKKDVVGAKLKRSFLALQQHLVTNEFKILEARWEWRGEGHDALLYLRVASLQTTPLKRYPGPRPSDDPSHIAAFKQAHAKDTIALERGRHVAYAKRPYTELRNFVVARLSSDKDVLFKRFAIVAS